MSAAAAQILNAALRVPSRLSVEAHLWASTTNNTCYRLWRCCRSIRGQLIRPALRSHQVLRSLAADSAIPRRQCTVTSSNLIGCLLAPTIRHQPRNQPLNSLLVLHLLLVAVAVELVVHDPLKYPPALLIFPYVSFLKIEISNNRFIIVCLFSKVDVSDCVYLDPLNEDSFTANLLSRFKRDQIYVRIRHSFSYYYNHLLLNWIARIKSSTATH